MGVLKKLPTISISLLLFSVFFVAMGCYQLSISNQYKDISIVDIGNGVVSAENEGKNVCVTGKLEIEELPIDDQTLFKANSVALIRTVEMYQYYLSSDNDDLYEGFQSEQMLDIKSKNGDEYYNPSFPDNVKNKVFFAKAKIGDLVIKEEFLNKIIESNIITVDDKTEKTIERKYLEDIAIKNYVACGDGYFTDGNPDNYEIGDLRVKFEYIDMDDLGELTICGCQKNGELVADENSYNEVFYSTPSDKIEEYCAHNDHKLASIIFFFNSGLMIVVAISVFISKSKKGVRA